MPERPSLTYSALRTPLTREGQHLGIGSLFETVVPPGTTPPLSKESGTHACSENLAVFRKSFCMRMRASGICDTGFFRLYSVRVWKQSDDLERQPNKKRLARRAALPFEELKKVPI